MTSSVVAAVVRQEGRYIQEWVAYQYLIGFDAIIVMLHNYRNEPDNTLTKIQQLPDYILEKVIIGEISEEDISGVDNPMYQRAGMYKAFNEHIKGKFEWMAMFDADEYLFVKHNVNAFLSGFPPTTGQVVVSWLLFGHGNRVQSIQYPETRLSAFTNYSKECTGFKSIVRVDCVPQIEWYHCHFAKGVPNTTSCNGRIIRDTPVNDWYELQPVMRHYPIEDVCLAHYYTGAMEDWVNRHKRRAFACHKEHDVKRFIECSSDYQDDRMLLYNDELKDILSKVQR